MKNPALEKAIAAIGGPVAVAYKCGKSVTGVNAWRANGRVRLAEDCLRIAELSHEAGYPVTVEELAGLGAPRRSASKVATGMVSRG